MVIRKEDETKEILLDEISSVVLHTTQAYLSAYLLSELAKNKISLVISDEQHNPIGQYLPLYGAHNVSKKVNEQLAWTEPSKKRVWQHVVREKIRMQARVLEDYECYAVSRELYASVAEVRSGDTTNREGAAARHYFAALFGLEFNRDLECATNAALNYGYAILLSLINREIVSRGFLTQCGICHRNEYNQFNLGCDFMEPFRPIVDRIVLETLSIDFDKNVRRSLTDLPNRMLSYRGGTYRLQSVASYFVQDCLNVLNKKCAVEEIDIFDAI